MVLLYLETLLQLRFFEVLTTAFWYTAAFTGAIALLISAILGLLGQTWNRWLSVALTAVLCLLFCSQVVYEAVFGTMFSVAQMGMGGAAVTNFWKETAATVMQNIPFLLLLLLPVPTVVFLSVKCKAVFLPRRDSLALLALVLALALHMGVLWGLEAGGTGYYSDYYFYHSPDTTTDQAARRFGLLTTTRLELFAGADTQEEAPGLEILTPETTTRPAPVETLPGETTPATEETQPEPKYNVLEIDFDRLNSLTQDEKLLEMNAYVNSLTGTKQNAYTGMLADYNLITICAESFSTAAIHKELTPTLYRLSTEGFVFNNFYNSYLNVTTDGEYSFCLGLWPDTARDRDASSFYATRKSYLPFALGNVFTQQAGAKAYGYHNYLASYYGRDETHPNMGYTCRFARAGMTFTSTWPASDLEMLEQSVGDYIGSGEQFHAYYMTFSGHYMYDTRYNPIAEKNYDAVKHLDYSEAGKCYLACNYELELAMTYLMEQLEAAGIAHKTAIVLAGDHYPYGLKDREYAELMGHDVDAIGKQKSTLIFWVGGMEESVYVDEYMCTNDILPTILNLWGFSYDSRLLAGKDILSDGEHIAVLRDQSFLTDKVCFNASTGEATWFVEESSVPQGYLERLIKTVKNQFLFSANILNKGYYDFLFREAAVEVGTQGWIEGSLWDKDEEEEPAPPPETAPSTEETTAPPEETVAPETQPSTEETEEATEPTAGETLPSTEPPVEETEPATTPAAEETTVPTDTGAGQLP